MQPNTPIRYSFHFIQQMESRSFPDGLAERIFEYADARYFDLLHNNLVAVKREDYLGVTRDVSLAFVALEDATVFLTIYPLKEGQQGRSLQACRWVRYDPETSL